MRERRDIFNGLDGKPGALQSGDGAFPSGTRSLDPNFKLLDAELAGPFGTGFGGALRGERGALTTPLESAGTGGGPAENVAVHIGDCDGGVVERGLDVGDATGHVTSNLLFLNLRHPKSPAEPAIDFTKLVSVELPTVRPTCEFQQSDGASRRP